MQKDKQPQDEKVIQKLNARAQTFAANTLGNAGQKRTEQVIQWLEQIGVHFEGAKVLDIARIMRITTKELVHTDAIIEDQLTVNLLGELTLHQESWILYYLPSMTILD